MLNLRSPWLAMQVDEAVFYYGRYLESRLNERDKRGKPKWKLHQLLNVRREVASVTDLMLASGADSLDI